MILKQLAKALIRLRVCAGWSEPVLVAHTTLLDISCCGSLVLSKANMHRRSYMSAHVLLNLLNELGKRDKMRGLPSILSLFRNEFKYTH